MENIQNKISIKIGDTILANNNYGKLSYHKSYNLVDEAIDIGYLKLIIRDLIAWQIKWDFERKTNII